VQRSLRGLRDRADQQKEARHRMRAETAAPVLARGTAQLREIDGVELGQQHERPGHERGVAHALDDERLQRGSRRRRMVAVIRDEQVRRDASQLPPDDDQHEIRAEDDDEHPGDEQADRAEIPL